MDGSVLPYIPALTILHSRNITICFDTDKSHFPQKGGEIIYRLMKGFWFKIPLDILVWKNLIHYGVGRFHKN